MPALRSADPSSKPPSGNGNRIYPEGVRGFEMVWHVDGHVFLSLVFRLEAIDDRFGFEVLLEQRRSLLRKPPKAVAASARTS